MIQAIKSLKSSFNRTERNRIYSEANTELNEGINQVFKFQNAEGKWKFKWIKVTSFTKSIFESDFCYDQILNVQNNCIYFIKNNKKGFWFYNTQTEFSIINI
jgi:hypothetical protein